MGISNSLAMVIGRTMMEIISEKSTYNSFLLFISVGGLFVLIAFGLNHNIWIGFFLCFLQCLCMVAMFAIALIITNKYFPGQTKKNN
ncbi:hypothetical protein P4U07_26105 [Bacillus mycoides]|uniref:hypothetical protein n=1 Tax=Bacillus mycoides TaxID=1405 RepID=UPI002E20901F|nr:hypothetical protein [Bacillus mycoides]